MQEDFKSLKPEQLEALKQLLGESDNVQLPDVSDWFDGVDGRFDLIAANPPYLSEADVASAEPEVRNYDPKSALVSADGGIADLRIILSRAPDYLTSGGCIICECGLEQPRKLAEEFKEVFAQIEILPDSSRRTRFFLGKAR